MKSVPQHIAIIMDGNRRWARSQGLPALAGHKKVLDDILEPIIEHAAKMGVSYITFWAWSTENWQRDKREVTGIMKLFKTQLKTKGNRLHEKGISVRIIGDISKFDTELQKLLKDLVEKTKHNTAITAIFALNYGGRDEINRAIKNVSRIKRQALGKKNGTGSDVTLDTLTPDTFSMFLDTRGVPDPELIIRTGGEQRLSGFLLWQSEYSELYFPSWFMPQFSPERLDEAIVEFQKRKRRFGV